MSAWGDRSSAFAVFLFLVTIFPSTLLPASIYGFCITGSGILLSGTVGGLVDKHGRLIVLRSATIAQKVSAVVIYAILLLFFLTSLGHEPARLSGKPLVAFVGIVLFGAVMKVSTVCLNISIERDWASTISRGSSDRLTKLNAWLRRIVNFLRDICGPCDINISPIYIGFDLRSCLSVVCFRTHSRRELLFCCCISVWYDSNCAGL